MPSNPSKSIPIFIDDRQVDIADLALAEFVAKWTRSNSHGRSDSQWLSQLRLDNRKSESSVADGDWAKFLTDYIVVRGFDAEKRAPISDCIAEQCSLDPTDFYALAKLWRTAGVTKHLQISAASKVLFFSAPQSECAIFDRLACLAIKARGVRFKVDSDGLKVYRKRVRSVVERHESVWVDTAAKYASSAEVGTDFILRRIADKHLFIEGSLIEAADGLQSAATTFSKLGFANEGSVIAREALKSGAKAVTERPK